MAGKLKTVGRELFVNRTLYLMFLPIGVFYLIFAYFPMTGIIVAFKNLNYRDGIFFSPWIEPWYKNFEFFFKSGKALLVIRNTIMYNLMFLAGYTLSSILVAVFISEIERTAFKKVTQSIMFLPYFISWVVVSAFVYNLFSYEYGAVNTLLQSLGLNRINIYITPRYWYWLLPGLYIWKWVGYGSVLYLAAIMGIDRESYESAEIDGANIFQRIWYVTLPALLPTIATLVLLGVGRIMRGEFDMFWQLVGKNGVLMDHTDIIDTLVFRSLMGNSDYGMASSTGLVQSVLCLVIITTVNGIVRKVEPDNALF
ncbi:MAG: ABC transporter permease subunit [Treponema sp.]|jgi:putative aldouronate transport system permease protein|nr:ABC transporter permease subunit [Treponema sp.]